VDTDGVRASADSFLILGLASGGFRLGAEADDDFGAFACTDFAGDGPSVRPVFLAMGGFSFQSPWSMAKVLSAEGSKEIARLAALLLPRRKFRSSSKVLDFLGR
jgi:hypothetical protein